MFGGAPDRALAALDEAKRLSPRDHLMVLWQTVKRVGASECGAFC